MTADPDQLQIRLRGLGPAAGLHLPPARTHLRRPAPLRRARPAPATASPPRASVRSSSACERPRPARGLQPQQPAASLLRRPDRLHAHDQLRPELGAGQAALQSRAERADHQQPDRGAAERNGDRLLHRDPAERRHAHRHAPLHRPRRDVQRSDLRRRDRHRVRHRHAGRAGAGARRLDPVRHRRRSRQRQPLPRLAGRPLPRRRRGRLLDVDRRRPATGRRRSRSTRPRRTPTRCASRSSCPRSRSAQHGELVVTYYDFRFDTDDGRERADHWAIFCDPDDDNCRNPQNWGGERRLTTASFDVLQAPIARGYFLGDYMGLVAAGNKVFPGLRHRRGREPDEHLHPADRPIADRDHSMSSLPGLTRQSIPWRSSVGRNVTEWMPGSSPGMTTSAMSSDLLLASMFALLLRGLRRGGGASARLRGGAGIRPCRT